MTMPNYDAISVVPEPPEGYQVVEQVDAIDMSPEITYSHHVPLWMCMALNLTDLQTATFVVSISWRLCTGCS